ncbi:MULTISPECIES: hypothetical protein [unclassified Sphingomonas]|uniref:hypothetical protein n=1 Tax=unclassified Sphingomonas TaxID=196159 RepID=UPI00226AD26F|nr:MULTISPECIES: hypothetical protein [unclassified Sphingomonas]
MSLLSPAMEAALQQPQATIFGAIRMDLPGRTVRLLVGSGVVNFTVDGVLETFTGKDEVIGVFSAIDTLTDGLGDEAPALSLTFMPEGEAAAAQLASVSMQGSPVRLWLGAIDIQTGLVIGDPLLLFNGLLDVATLNLSTTGRTVDYEVTSIFEDFFLSDDGARLSDTFHQYLWPGELGCSFITYVGQQIYWGTSSPDGVKR